MLLKVHLRVVIVTSKEHLLPPPFIKVHIIDWLCCHLQPTTLSVFCWVTSWSAGLRRLTIAPALCHSQAAANRGKPAGPGGPLQVNVLYERQLAATWSAVWMDGDTLCAEKGIENQCVLGERLFNLRRREVCRWPWWMWNGG